MPTALAPRQIALRTSVPGGVRETFECKSVRDEAEGRSGQQTASFTSLHATIDDCTRQMARVTVFGKSSEEHHGKYGFYRSAL